MLRLLKILPSDGGEVQSLALMEQYRRAGERWLTNEKIFKNVLVYVRHGYAVMTDPEGHEVQTPSSDLYENFHASGFDGLKNYSIRLTPAGQHLAKAVPSLTLEENSEDLNKMLWSGHEVALQLLSRIIAPLDSNLFWWQSKKYGWDEAEINSALEEYEHIGLVKTYIQSTPPGYKFVRAMTWIKEITPAGLDFAQAMKEAEVMVREARKPARPEKSGLRKYFPGFPPG